MSLLKQKPNELLSLFKEHYQCEASHYCVSPGRVNLIGEHTDYNEGFVLPVALQYATSIVAKPRDDGMVNIRSLQYPDHLDSFDSGQVIIHSDVPWCNYIRGVAKEFVDRGLNIDGCDVLLTSDVPQGSGLSSSAALEVAVAGLFNSIGMHGLDLEEIAKIGQAAENNFIDCQCGIMDQLISAKAKADHAMLIDCRDLSTQAVSIPDSLVMLVINSNYPRKLAESEYNERRIACEQAAQMMQVVSLRDATLLKLEAVKPDMSDVMYRRAKHIITENQRVLETIDSLKNNDIKRFYQIMRAAHMSLVHDFEITVDATRDLVDICFEAADGAAGVRQTGGGFGGAIICVCAPDKIDAITEAVNSKYTDKQGLVADIYVCQASQGLQVFEY